VRTAAAALAGVPGARAIDEHAAHHPRGDGQELRPVLPVHAPLIDEAHVGFVHERGGLQRMSGPLPPQVRGGAAAQLGIDQTHGALTSVEVSCRPGVEELRDVAG
jgi:hypothetical protein